MVGQIRQVRQVEQIKQTITPTPPKKRQQKKRRKILRLYSSDSNRIQTCNLRIRSAMLYSVELWSRCFSFAVAKLQHFSLPAKYFSIFFY